MHEPKLYSLVTEPSPGPAQAELAPSGVAGAAALQLWLPPQARQVAARLVRVEVAAAAQLLLRSFQGALGNYACDTQRVQRSSLKAEFNLHSEESAVNGEIDVSAGYQAKMETFLVYHEGKGKGI